MSFYPDGSLCPCGSGKNYSDCCQPVHQEHANAVVPEQLMRARYCAHVLNLVDFVVATYHPSCHAEEEREGIAESVALNWVKLDVIDAPLPEDNNEGFVEFRAYLNENGIVQRMHERSRFLKENGLWYYIDGTFAEEESSEEENPEEKSPEAVKPTEARTAKVGRNDPCPCGSGKKYKKCCG